MRLRLLDRYVLSELLYLVICIFLCWEWGRWVVYLVSVYLVLFCLGGN